MQISRPMSLRSLVAIALLLFAAASFAGEKNGEAKHVVVVVWDGMRPDFVTPKNAPTLADLARDGVFFRNNHSAYPSSTNVNGVVLATGEEPTHNGIVANQEFRPAIDPHKAFDTSDFPVLDNERFADQFIASATVAEIVQKAGYRTAISGSKPVAQLAGRSREHQSEAGRSSIVVYRGRALPASALAAIAATIGPFPKRTGFPNDKEDAWSTRALTEFLWRDGVPKFSLLWLSEPDLSQHETAPGSPTALAAIKSSDHNLAQVLAALKAKNALTTTDLFVVSDHGFSTVDLAVDVAALLRSAGFDAVREFADQPPAGQILVVTLGGSVAFYVVKHDPEVIRRLVEFLQRSDFAGVIMTHAAHEGIFTFGQAQIDAPDAPDVMTACRWNDWPNEYGIAGEIACDIGRDAGHGTHSTLSPHDMNNTLIASGPDFRRGWTDETPSGNVDVAPTILWILGLAAPHPMDGRVLREALVGARKPPTATEKTLEAQRDLGGSTWRQHLRTATVDGVTYLMEGNGAAAP
jgi:arylsulfatase A-like enzyme